MAFMSNLHALFRISALIAAVTLGMVSTRALSGPSNEALTPAAIAEYDLKLANVQTIQADLSIRVTCLNKREQTLISQRDVAQLQLGDLRSREHVLNSNLVSQQAAHDAYKRAYETESEALNNLHHKLGSLQSRKWAQEEAVRRCKADAWIFGFFCDGAYEIGVGLGLDGFEHLESSISAAQSKVNASYDAVNTAQQALERSRSELAATQTEASALIATIHNTEQEIVALAAALSALRNEARDFARLRDEFQNALNEARRIDTSDGRARTARAVQYISAKVDDALVRLAPVAAQAEAALPSGWMNSCLAS